MQNSQNQTHSNDLKSLCNDAIRQLKEIQRIVAEMHQNDLEIAQSIERMIK